MTHNRVEDLMKKHPPWFIFDFHPIRFAKKLSGEGSEDERETDVEEEWKTRRLLRGCQIKVDSWTDRQSHPSGEDNFE
jgi:hypothetical protein